MATVEDLPKGRVTGQYLFVSQDNEDAGTAPNVVVVNGYVRFTCSATPPLRYQTKKVSAVPLVHDAIFDSQGYLMPMVTGNNGAVITGSIERGLELLADAPGVNPRGFTWQVEFNLREAATGRAIDIPSFHIYVSDGAEIDLTDVGEITASNGVRIIRGDSAYDLALEAGFVGTMEQWIASLKGLKGDKGDKGNKGDTGATPNIAIGNVVTAANPGDDVWMAQLLRQGPASQQAIRDTMPSTMKGDKGDTGIGWQSTHLGTTNLNDIITPGVYRQDTAANATLESNYPLAATPGAGVLVVMRQGSTDAQALLQVFYSIWGAHAARGTYIRTRTGGVWTAWMFSPTQRVDETAGRAIYTWDPLNGREQMIYGDTGMRGIGTETALFPNEFTNTSVQIRRVGNYVSLFFDTMKSLTATGNPTFINLPVGFRTDLTNGSGNMRYGLATELSGATPTVISPMPAYGAQTSSELRFLTYPTGKGLHGSVSFYTRDPWPTTLPGTAIGTVPNV